MNVSVNRIDMNDRDVMRPCINVCRLKLKVFCTWNHFRVHEMLHTILVM